MLFARGVLAVLFGVVAVGWPGITVQALAMVFAIYSIREGLTFILGAVRGRAAWGHAEWPRASRRRRYGDAAVARYHGPRGAYVLATSTILAGMVGAVGAVTLETTLGGRPGWQVAAYLLLVLLGVLPLAPGEGIMGIVWLLGTCAVLFGTTLTIGPDDSANAPSRPTSCNRRAPGVELTPTVDRQHPGRFAGEMTAPGPARRQSPAFVAHDLRLRPAGGRTRRRSRARSLLRRVQIAPDHVGRLCHQFRIGGGTRTPLHTPGWDPVLAPSLTTTATLNPRYTPT
ncbi:hypothetical protein CJ179_00545 [Rhodococcus sp. ACS1]|uniref:DUF308 domain-containing protein n=1 Tax=Rhodococcus sp. ACS1 TaxID=2028570 RepID=UPI000BB1222B|nr:hypothetical protein CJ179_00545 [Rhodococcus sp. ACS1]